jgi:uncharacterized membrane protein YwzB
MTVSFIPLPYVIISQILLLAGFLLLLKAFWALRTVNEDGKTTVTGKIDPKLIKIGLALIIAVFGYNVINFFVG